MAKSSPNELLTSLYALALSTTGYACQILYTKILTHNLSLAEYGDFSVALKGLILVSLLLTYGSSLSAQQFISQYVRAKDNEKKQGFIYWVLSVLVRSSLILAVFYILFWIIATLTHLTELYSFDQYHLALFVIIFAPLQSLATICLGLILGYGYPMTATVIGSALLSGAQLLVAYTFFSTFLANHAQNLSLLVISVVTSSMMLSTLVALLIPENQILNSMTPKSDAHFHDHQWSTVSQAACLNSIMYTFGNMVDIYILEIFSPQEHHVGIFSVCGVCVGLLVSIQRAISQQLVNPIMNIDSMDKQEIRNLQRSLDSFNIIKLFLVIGTIVLSWYYRVEIFTFFNIHSSSGYLLLPIMLLNVYLVDGRFQFAFLMSHKQMGAVNAAQSSSLVIMVVAALILVFPYHMYGVVIATTISRLFIRFYFVYLCRKLSPIRFMLFA